MTLLPLSQFCPPANLLSNMSSSSNNSVSSHLAILTVWVPSNNQASQVGVDNRVTIEQFANLDTTCQGHSHPKLSAPLRGSNRPLLASTELAW